MNIGDYGDVETLAECVGDEALRDALVHAEAGQFNERSWAYWHYRLGLANLELTPPLPTRRVWREQYFYTTPRRFTAGASGVMAPIKIARTAGLCSLWRHGDCLALRPPPIDRF